MYLAIDIGGTKTLIASFTNSGKIVETAKFTTKQKYLDQIAEIKKTLIDFKHNHFAVVCVAAPGIIDRKKGIGTIFGNLPWKNVPIRRDIKKITKCPILLENDANLAGLSEATYVKNEYKKVVYITISTGIGSGIITNDIIDPDFQDSEIGHMKVQFNDKMKIWEDIASGSAIVKIYGKKASQIKDKKTWQEISHRLSLGINSLIATIQPDIIIIGGSVGSYFKKYEKFLINELKKLSTPLTPVPKLKQAKQSEEAVIYGCYHLANRYYEDNT